MKVPVIIQLSTINLKIIFPVKRQLLSQFGNICTSQNVTQNTKTRKQITKLQKQKETLKETKNHLKQ